MLNMDINYKVNMDMLEAENKYVRVHKLEKDPSPKELFLAGGMITIYRLLITRGPGDCDYSFTPQWEDSFSVKAPEGIGDDEFDDLCSKKEKEFYTCIFKDLVWDTHMHHITGTVYDRGQAKTFVFDGYNNCFVQNLSGDADVSVKISREYLPEIIYNREMYCGYPGGYVDDKDEVQHITEEDWDMILRKIITAMKINQYDIPYCMDMEEVGYTDLRKAADEGNKLFGQFLGDL